MGTSGASPSTNQPAGLPLQDTAQPAQTDKTGKTGNSGGGHVTGSDGGWLPTVASSSPLAQVKPFVLADVAGKFAQGGLSALTPDEFASLASFVERVMNDPAAFTKEQGGKASLLLSLVFTLTADLKVTAESGALAKYLASHGLNGDGAARNWQATVENLPKPPAINEPNLGRLVNVNTANHRLDGVALPFVAAAKPVPISYYVGGEQVIATNSERAKFEREIAARLGFDPLTGPGFEIYQAPMPSAPPAAESETANIPQISWPETPIPISELNLSGDPEEMLREDGMRQAYAAVYQIFGKLSLTWPPNLPLPGASGSTDAYALPGLLEEAYNQIAVEYMDLGLEPPFMLPSGKAIEDPAAWVAINAAIDPVGFAALRHGNTAESYPLSPLPGDDYIPVRVPGFGEIQALQSTQNAELARALLDQRARLTTLEANLALCQTILSGLPPANWFQERMAGAPPSLHDINYSLKAARVALAKGDLAGYYREYHEFQTAVAKFNSDINAFLVELAEADETVRDFVTTVGTISMALLVVASVVGTGGTTTPAVVAGAMRLALAIPVATTVGGEFAHSALTGDKIDFSKISMSVALTLVAARGGPMVSSLMKRLITLPGANQLELAVLQQVATNLTMGTGIRGVTGLEAAIRQAQAEAATRGPLSLDEISELVTAHLLASMGDPKSLTIDVVIGALGGVGQYRMAPNALPSQTATPAQPKSTAPSTESAPVSEPVPQPRPVMERLGTVRIGGKPLNSTPENDNVLPGGQPQQLKATGSDDYVPTQVSPGIKSGNNPASSQDAPLRILNVAGGGNNPPKGPTGAEGWTTGATMPPNWRPAGGSTQPSPPTAGRTMPSPEQPQPRVNLTEVDAQLAEVQARLARLRTNPDQHTRHPAGGSTMPSPGQVEKGPVNLKEVESLLADVDTRLEQVLRSNATLRQSLMPTGAAHTTMPSPGAAGGTMPSPGAAPKPAGSTMQSPGQGPVDLAALQDQLAKIGLRLQPLTQGAHPSATPAAAGPGGSTMPSPPAAPPRGSTNPTPGQEPVDLAALQDQMAKAGIRLQTLIQGTPTTAPGATVAPPAGTSPGGSTMPSPGVGPVDLTAVQAQLAQVGLRLQPLIRGAPQAAPGATMPSPGASPAPRGSTMPSPGQGPVDLNALQLELQKVGLRLQPIIQGASPTGASGTAAGPTGPTPRPGGSTMPSPGNERPDTIPAGPPRDTPVPDTIPAGPPIETVSSVPPPPSASWQPPVAGSTIPAPGPKPVDLADVQAQLLRTGVRMEPLIQEAPLPPAHGPALTILPPAPPPGVLEQASIAKTMIPPRPEGPVQEAPNVSATLAEAQMLAARAQQRAGRVVNAGGDPVMQMKLKVEDLKRTVAELQNLPGGVSSNLSEWQETIKMLERVRTRLEPLK